MKKQTSVLALFLFLVGCGGGSTSAPTPPSPPAPGPSVTSVVVSPAAASVVVGQTQQFMVNVQGTGSFNPAVTWSSTGAAGTVDSNGLFTASSNPGPVFVTATSVQTPTVSGQAQVTVTQATVSLPGWHGNLLSSDGVTTLSMDFDLSQTGSALTSGPVLTINPSSGTTDCKNFDIGEAIVSNAASLNKISGTVSGQSVAMTYTPPSNTTPNAITLTGVLGLDANGFATITGTFTKSASGCFANVTSGTFSFTQYQILTGNYLGSLTYGNGLNNNVQFHLNNSEVWYDAIPAPFSCPASPTFKMQEQSAGRYFYLATNATGQGATNLIVYGLVAGVDQQGNQLNGFVSTTNVTSGGCFNPTSAIPSTFTRQ